MLQTIYESSAIKKYPVGMRLALDDRAFRYCHIADVDYVGNLAAFWGHVNDNAPSEDNVLLPVVTVVDSYDMTITDTVGTVAAHDYKDAWIFIHRAAGYRNQAYRIRDNEANVGGAGGTVVLHLYDPIAYANSLGCHVYVHKNIYSNVLYVPLAAGGLGWHAFVGIPWVCPVRNEYCWLQTWGPGFGISSGAVGGAAQYNRALYFNGNDGSLLTGLGTQGIGWDDTLQYAGHTLPDTHGGAQAEIFFMLQISP